VGLASTLGGRRGPAELVLVRHGESIGNVADAEARRSGAARLELSARDADVALSDAGRDQAEAVGRWLSALDEEHRPVLVLSSPYARAADTARAAVADTGLEVVVDERLRERDLGLLDGLTSSGLTAEFPDEAARRKKLGKFYYQPPSGESWADVVLRVRSLLADLREGYDGQRVCAFSHQAVIMSFRYVLEDLDEQTLLDLEHSAPVPNASLTRYRRSGDRLELVTAGDTSVVEAGAAPETREPARAGRGEPADA
jgi:broad specificity phosphatase PhoE